MAIARNTLAQPVDRPQLHVQLRDWVRKNDDRIVGDESVPGVKPWLFVRHEGKTFKIHADTRRSAVEEYLRKVDLLGEELDWHIVANQRGNENAVAFGDEKQRIEGLYLYLVK